MCVSEDWKISMQCIHQSVWYKNIPPGKRWTQNFKLARAKVLKKKIQIGIHIVSKNYKYTKSLFLNTLRCNHLPTKTKKKNF